MMASVRYTFTLNVIKDAEVIRWLEAQSNVSAAVRAALRAYVHRPTHDDLAARLDEVLSALQTTTRTVAPVSTEAEGDEPDVAVKGFGKMLQKFGMD